MSSKSPLPVDKQVGSRVRARRLMLDMSQSDLAEALGLTFQQVQKYEKGANRIGSSRMVQIAEALGVAPAYFYEGVGPTFGEDTTSALVNGFLASKGGFQIVQAFMAIENANLRRCIVSLVQRIAGLDNVEEDGPGSASRGRPP
jgi:transcriptional regulator with XRE-family HTH domain